MGRRKKTDWSPYAVPGIRDNLVRGLAQASQHTAGKAAVARAAGRLANADSLQAGVDRNLADCDALDTAALFWVSADMADVALDASRDIPRLDADAPPADAGLMLFESPLPDYRTTSMGGLRLRDPATFEPHLHDYTAPVPVDGIMWRPAGGHFQVAPLVRTERLPDPLFAAHLAVTPFTTVTLPLPADFTAQRAALSPEGVASESDSFGLVAFLAAAWHLMAAPNIAEAVDVEPRTGTRRAADVTAPLEPSLVRVIEARPMRTVRATGESSGRTYTHRWVVRGHWRDQPYGAGRKLRRTQWVESYLKGPEGAPIKRHDIVRAWRR